MQRTDGEISFLIQHDETRPEGFNMLVETYQQQVYALIRRMVINHDDADDVAQETFIKVWKNLGHYRGDSALFTWIYRIAVNEALQFLRRKRITAMFTFQGTDNNLESSLHNDAFYQADEIQDKFQKALLVLPDKQRLVFNLKYFSELPYEQISEITGTSVGALKASYHHAVKKIREKLTEQ